MEETHFIDMMRAVQPHVSGRPRRSVELLLQSADLLRSIQQYREPELSACDASQDSIDFEGYPSRFFHLYRNLDGTLMCSYERLVVYLGTLH